MLFILKIKGTDTIPDFVQIRDKNMTLKAYFRLSQQERSLIKHGFERDAEKIMKLLDVMEFGKIYKYNPVLSS
tara:strand:- start:395 stop:613 length:219 start_codon:yes stop_codon:yes gene_type:complete